MSEVAAAIQYAMGKAGKTYDPMVDYVLTTPSQVATKLAQGWVKECSFEERLGQKMIVLSPKPEPVVEPKTKTKFGRKGRK